MSIERDPNGRLPGEPGAKLDAGKVPLHRGLLAQFPRACLAVAQVSSIGAQKYRWNGWRSVPDGVQRYRDAAARHEAAIAMGEEFDACGLPHAAHAAWNALAVLELELIEREEARQAER